MPPVWETSKAAPDNPTSWHVPLYAARSPWSGLVDWLLKDRKQQERRNVVPVIQYKRAVASNLGMGSLTPS